MYISNETLHKIMELWMEVLTAEPPKPPRPTFTKEMSARVIQDYLKPPIIIEPGLMLDLSNIIIASVEVTVNQVLVMTSHGETIPITSMVIQDQFLGWVLATMPIEVWYTFLETRDITSKTAAISHAHDLLNDAKAKFMEVYPEVKLVEDKEVVEENKVVEGQTN